MSDMSDGAVIANVKALVVGSWDDFSLVHSYVIIPKLYWHTMVRDTLETLMKDSCHVIKTEKTKNYFFCPVHYRILLTLCIKIAK